MIEINQRVYRKSNDDLDLFQKIFQVILHAAIMINRDVQQR